MRASRWSAQPVSSCYPWIRTAFNLSFGVELRKSVKTRGEFNAASTAALLASLAREPLMSKKRDGRKEIAGELKAREQEREREGGRETAEESDRRT